jgi:hypothetical protein
MTAPTYAMRLPSRILSAYDRIAAYLTGRAGAGLFDDRATATRRMAGRANANRHEVVELLARYGIEAKESSPIVVAFARRPAAWREFAVQFEAREARRARST